MALESRRGAFALAALKSRFPRATARIGLAARHARPLLRLYLATDYSQDLARAFRRERKPRRDTFGHAISPNLGLNTIN